MTAVQHYSKPPITEALIDLRVEKAESLTLAQLEKCHEGEDKAYPKKGNLSPASAQAQLMREGQSASFPPAADASQIGYLFKSADGRQIFQVSFEGFTMNWLAPYPGWEVVRDEARRLWNVYRERTRPLKVTRIGVRYINRFDFPGPTVELKDYLLTSPEVSPCLPQQQQLVAFFMQLAIPQSEIKATLLLSETTLPAPTPNISSMALDIHLFRSEELPSDEAAMWGLFDDLRRRKNEIFEACITDKTRELIL